MAKKGKAGETLVIASKLKDAIRSGGCNVSSDVIDGVSAKLHGMVKEAIARCKENGRKTVRSHDF